MKKVSVFLVLLLISWSVNASAYCDSEFISSKTSDGSVLVLSDGSVWEIDSIDRIDTMLWLPTDDVLVCDDSYIVNKDSGEKVGATRLK